MAQEGGRKTHLQREAALLRPPALAHPTRAGYILKDAIDLIDVDVFANISKCSSYNTTNAFPHTIFQPRPNPFKEISKFQSKNVVGRHTDARELV